MIAGEKAPDFTLYDHTGRPRTLSALLSEGPVVLFFFPLASSPICTAQACHFRDLSSEFATVGAQRVGISTDTVDKQAHFAQQRSFDYPLLSDADGVVSELFGVRRGRLAKLRKSVVAGEADRRTRHTRRRGLLGRLLPVRRTTFVIDTDRTVLKVISSELRASVHADQTLSFLQNHNVPHSSPHVREKRTAAHQQSEGKGGPIDLFTEPETTDEPSLVRPYTLTAGRTDSGVELPLEWVPRRDGEREDLVAPSERHRRDGVERHDEQQQQPHDPGCRKRWVVPASLPDDPARRCRHPPEVTLPP